VIFLLIDFLGKIKENIMKADLRLSDIFNLSKLLMACKHEYEIKDIVYYKVNMFFSNNYYRTYINQCKKCGVLESLNIKISKEEYKKGLKDNKEN